MLHIPLTSGDGRSPAAGHDLRRVVAAVVADLPTRARAVPVDGSHVHHKDVELLWLRREVAVLRRTNPMNDQSAAARRGSVDREARPTRRNVSAAIKPHLNPPIHYAKRQIPAPARPRSELRPAETQLALVMASETSLRVCVLTGCSDGWSYGQSHEHLPGAGVPRFGGRVPLLTQLRWHPCPIRRPRRDPARSRTPVPPSTVLDGDQ